MKGKLLRPYEVDMTHTICAGEVCEFERNPIMGYTCHHCGRKYDIMDSDSNDPDKFCCIACEYGY